jgi:hypothetical protein
LLRLDRPATYFLAGFQDEGSDIAVAIGRACNHVNPSSKIGFRSAAPGIARANDLTLLTRRGDLAEMDAPPASGPAWPSSIAPISVPMQ